MIAQRQTYLSVLGSVAAMLSLFGVARPALATPTKDQCIDANTQAQNFKRDGKLLSARLALRSCADLACPKLVQTDCTRRLDELEQAIPSITFDVKDGAGRDLSAVTVMMDEKALVDHLDGTPIEIDPGAHVFTFKTADQSPVTRSLVIQQGERGRREAITLGAPPTAIALPETTTAVVGAPAPALAVPSETHATPAPSTASTPAPTSEGSSARRTLAWTALGVGAAGLVVGGITGGLALNKKHSIDGDPTCRQNACPPGQPDVSSYDNLRTISSVGFIAGGVLAATGVVLLLTAPSHSQNSAALWLGPNSAGVVGRFQ